MRQGAGLAVVNLTDDEFYLSLMPQQLIEKKITAQGFSAVARVYLLCNEQSHNKSK